MTEVGKAELTIIPSFKGGQRALEKQLSISSTGAVNASGRQAGNAFMGGMRSVVGPATALLGGGLAIDFAKDAISEASDLSESINALDVVYGDLGATTNAIGEEAAGNLGLSNLDFNNLSVQFSGFAKTVAGDGGDVVGTLDDLTTRAADFASVMNLEVSEAAQLFQSGLAGESEPLRRFSIDLSAAAVDAYAYANGIADVGEKLTEAEKVQARYGLLMERTNNTAGDFENTSGSLANQTRILAGEWDNMRAELGEQLLPVMQDVTGWILDDGLPALKGFVDDLDDPSTTIGSLVESLGAAGDGAEQLWDAVDTPVLDGLESAARFAGMVASGLASGLEIIQDEGWAEFAVTWGEGAGLVDRDKIDEFNRRREDDGLPGALDFLFNQTETNLGSGLQGLADFYVDSDSAATNTDLDRGLNNVRLPGTPDIIDAISAAVPTGEPVDLSGDTIAAIKAPGGPLDPLSSGNVIVNIGTVNATDTDDIVRKARQAARTNSWSGSRNGAGIDPRLTR